MSSAKAIVFWQKAELYASVLSSRVGIASSFEMFLVLIHITRKRQPIPGAVGVVSPEHVFLNRKNERLLQSIRHKSFLVFFA